MSSEEIAYSRGGATLLLCIMEICVCFSAYLLTCAHLVVILYGGKGDDLNVYYNSIEIIDLGTLLFARRNISHVEKELIELKPEDIAKKNLEEEEDIQAWSRKSLEYLQVRILPIL